MIKVKNHQMPPTILVERALGMSSDPSGEEQKQRSGQSSGLNVRTSNRCTGLT